MLNVNWIGLSIPFAYIAVLVSSLITFSSVYRKRRAAAAAALTPWFPSHIQRDIYLSLMHIESEENKSKTVPDSLKCAALLRRAVEDIYRIIQIRNSKQACCSLQQRGSVGDNLWQMFLRAEKDMENEIADVVMEANRLHPNWGKTIFQSANEIASNTVTRNCLEDIQRKVSFEKKWWENRREHIQAEFMKELDTKTSNQSRATKVGIEDDAVLVEATMSDKGTVRSRKSKK